MGDWALKLQSGSVLLRLFSTEVDCCPIENLGRVAFSTFMKVEMRFGPILSGHFENVPLATVNLDIVVVAHLREQPESKFTHARANNLSTQREALKHALPIESLRGLGLLRARQALQGGAVVAHVVSGMPAYRLLAHRANSSDLLL